MGIVSWLTRASHGLNCPFSNHMLESPPGSAESKPNYLKGFKILLHQPRLLSTPSTTLLPQLQTSTTWI